MAATSSGIPKRLNGVSARSARILDTDRGRVGSQLGVRMAVGVPETL